MPTLYTIGHSNHTWDEFLQMLTANKIKHLIDVRTIPKSCFVPWTNQKILQSNLNKEKITYMNMKELGGMRHPKKDSINLGWKSSGFRGFADYMQTNEFHEALKQLNQAIKKGKTAIMCAEALPWRCHRSLISDAEVVKGIKVLHIMNKTSLKEHILTEFAVVDKTKKPTRIYYPKDKNFTLSI